MTNFSERFRAMADFILRIGPRGLPVLTSGDSYLPWETLPPPQQFI